MKNEGYNTFRIYHNSFSVGTDGMNYGERAVFGLILAYLEAGDSVTQYDIIKANGAKEVTTYAIIKRLILKGYLSASRSNQYFSRSYLSLTEKGLLLKAHIKKTLLQGIK